MSLKVSGQVANRMYELSELVITQSPRHGMRCSYINRRLDSGVSRGWQPGLGGVFWEYLGRRFGGQQVGKGGARDAANVGSRRLKCLSWKPI